MKHETSSEKFIWAFCVSGYEFDFTPDLKDFELTDHPMTEKEFLELLWDAECGEANSHDQDTDECPYCGGSGVDEETEESCFFCDGSGQVDAYDWSEHVERSTSSKYFKYDPDEHAAIPSEFPEHLEYKAKEILEDSKRALEREVLRRDRLLEELRQVELKVASASSKVEEAETFAKEVLGDKYV